MRGPQAGPHGVTVDAMVVHGLDTQGATVNTILQSQLEAGRAAVILHGLVAVIKAVHLGRSALSC